MEDVLCARRRKLFGECAMLLTTAQLLADNNRFAQTQKKKKMISAIDTTSSFG